LITTGADKLLCFRFGMIRIEVWLECLSFEVRVNITLGWVAISLRTTELAHEGNRRAARL